MMRHLFFFGILFLASCSPHHVQIHNNSLAPTPATFSRITLEEKTETNTNQFWWSQFEDKELQELLSRALKNNFSLQSAWSRLEQARARAMQSGSAQYPTIDISGSAQRDRAKDRTLFRIEGIQPGDDVQYNSNFFVQTGLSYEIDLWKRVASLTNAERLRTSASEADAQSTALLLASSVTETWFTAKEQYNLLELLKQQVETSRDLLELTELRFALGKGTALDVYQQRQQLAATESEMPIVESSYATSLNQLKTLTGIPATEDLEIAPNSELPPLPQAPSNISPIDLFATRPDVRQVQLELQASEYDIASALAERFPKLRVGLSYDFRASDISDLFASQLGSILADITVPLLDGERRRGVVRERTARRDQLLSDFTQSFLVAIEEVENALIAEQFQKQLLEQIQHRVTLAKASLNEAKARYVNGLSNYVDVLVAVQELQTLERREISEKRSLLATRNRLYRAIGGSWTQTLDSNVKNLSNDQDGDQSDA